MSTAERWEQIKPILFEAMERPPGERSAYLEAACAGDPGLRIEIERYLAADPQAVSILETPLTHPLVPLPEASLEGQRIGPYNLLETIGEGGMATVYLAERADGSSTRRVACKVLRATLGGAELRWRFSQEIRILANLSHPNIATLYDEGEQKDGRACFFMEYVDGKPITLYCEDHHLTLKERLALFEQICAAVLYAHRKGVIHSDLTPNNILVTAEGQIKLLDFGIAKILLPEADKSRLFHGGSFLTQEYASPEHFAKGDTTLMSDVFSLGVVLYEILTGCNPFQLSARGEPPVRPSDAVRLPAGGKTWWKVLRGDLDQIILKAMRENPEGRYLSVEQLLEDLANHRERRPVAARGNSLAYKAQRLVVRRWPAVVAVAGFMLTTLFFGIYEYRQSERLASALATTRRQTMKFERVSDFLVRLFEISDPSEARGSTITAREVLDRGSGRLRRDLRTEPDVRAGLLQTIGVVYRNLGLYNRAAPLLQEALSVNRTQHGPESLEAAESLDEWADLLKSRDDYPAAESAFRESDRIFHKLLPPGDLRVATADNDLAAALIEMKSETKEAKPLVQHALAVRVRHYGVNHPDVVNSLITLAALHHLEGKLKSAESLYRRALPILERFYPGDFPETANALNNLGSVLMADGKYAEAEARLREALAMRQRLLGPEHLKVADTMNELALALMDQNQYDETEKLFREVLRIRTKILGERNPDVAISLMSLGVFYQDLGRYDEALSISRKAMSIWRDVVGENHPNYVSSVENVGVLLLLLERYDEAEPLFLDVLAKRRAILGPKHPDVAVSLDCIANVAQKRGRYKVAESYSRQSIELRREALGKQHPLVATSLQGLGRTLEAQERYAEGESAAREAVGILAKTYLEGNWMTDAAEGLLASCLTGQKRFQEAEALLLPSYRHTVGMLGPDSPQARKLRERLDKLYRIWGKPAPSSGL